MTAYVIFCMTEVTDLEALQRYRVAAKPSLIAHAPRFLCGPNVAETLEGAPLEGIVVLEFETIDKAKAWYDSPEYQAAAAVRKTGTQMLAAIVEGR